MYTMQAIKTVLKIKTRVPGFTIAEILVVLALTSLSVALSYSALNYTQKIFTSYQGQNRFLNQYTDLTERLRYESLKADLITDLGNDTFRILRDSSR